MWLIEIVPLEFHRRQLHRVQHAAGHIRSRYGGTISDGLKRGSLGIACQVWACLCRWIHGETNQKRPNTQGN